MGSEAIHALLASASIAKTSHFSLHAAPRRPAELQLPTEAAPDRNKAVDNLPALLLVVPKRHAKRAVTRNLIKRQMRQAARARGEALGAGSVLIRLRGGFDVRQFPSAASAALRDAVRSELVMLFDRAGTPP